MARAPITTWEMLNVAMDHFQNFIASKKFRYSLTFEDLIHVSNFKGGNASITEPPQTLPLKLEKYEKILQQISTSFSSKHLIGLDDNEEAKLIVSCSAFLALTSKQETKIRGFGASYASALLAAYFIDLVPVLDRRILNGAKIQVEYDSQKQVKNITRYYPDLIRSCRQELKNRENLTLRQLDKEWFAKDL